MSDFFLSTSGLRALVKEESVALFAQYARAFVRLFGRGSYLLATDTRPSRNLLLPEIVSAITSEGSDVITIGIAPTPVLPFLVKKMNFSGGIVLTASHNPMAYNGMKFIGPEGLFLGEEEIKRLKEEVELGKRGESKKKKGSHSYNPNLCDLYIEHLLDAKIFSGIKFKNFYCLVDACNGAVYYLIDRILEKVGSRVNHIYSPEHNKKPSFPRPPEPTADHLFKLKAAVLKEEGDLGIAFDPDGDRVSFVSEDGKALGEELTLPLALEFFLNRRKSPVVCNLSTTLLVDFVAQKYGVRTYRTKVGERNVIEEMMKKKALIGGEGNGGVIIPEINFTRDGILTTLLILALLSERGKLSSLVREFPRFFIKKLSFPYLPEKKELFFGLAEEMRKILCGKGEVKEDRQDGLWLGNESAFCHFRPSKTEPIFRIILCSKNRTLIDRAKEIIEEKLGGEKCVG
ncbi:MAG: hypothetical protein ABIK99_03875 [candidate division WOR-3 bacterium]